MSEKNGPLPNQPATSSLGCLPVVSGAITVVWAAWKFFTASWIGPAILVLIIGGAITMGLAALVRPRIEALEERSQAWHGDLAEARNTVITTTSTSVDLYERAPQQLRDADIHRRHAEHHFMQGAFTPFWESIEAAYARLGEYDAGVRQIAANAQAFPAQRQHLIDVSGDSSIAPVFPLTRDDLDALRIAEAEAQRLQSLVYEAQRQPTFAQIYEQRRTTAAVVSGFANLQEAVQRMHIDLAQRIEAVQAAIYDVGVQITDAIDDSTFQTVEAINATTRATYASAFVTWLSAHGATSDQLEGVRSLDARIEAATRSLQGIGEHLSAPRDHA